ERATHGHCYAHRYVDEHQIADRLLPSADLQIRNRCQPRVSPIIWTPCPAARGSPQRAPAGPPRGRARAARTGRAATRRACRGTRPARVRHGRIHGDGGRAAPRIPPLSPADCRTPSAYRLSCTALPPLGRPAPRPVAEPPPARLTRPAALPPRR